MKLAFLCGWVAATIVYVALVWPIRDAVSRAMTPAVCFPVLHGPTHLRITDGAGTRLADVR